MIATEGTVRGGAYQEAIQRRRPDAKVTARAAQVFVALAEEGMHEGPIADAVARHYLDAIFDPPGAQPGVSAAPRHARARLHALSYAGECDSGGGWALGVRIVDSAATTAKVVREQLAGARLLTGSGRTMVRFLATDGPGAFCASRHAILGQTLSPEDVELVDLSRAKRPSIAGRLRVQVDFFFPSFSPLLSSSSSPFPPLSPFLPSPHPGHLMSRTPKTRHTHSPPPTHLFFPILPPPPPSETFVRAGTAF